MAIVESLAGECSSFCYFLALSPARSNLPVNTHGKPGAHCSVLLIQCRPDTLGLTMLTTIHWRSSSDVPLMLYRRSSSTVHSLAYSGIRFDIHLPSRIPAHTHTLQTLATELLAALNAYDLAERQNVSERTRPSRRLILRASNTMS